MRIRLIALGSALLLCLTFNGHDAMAQSRAGGGSSGQNPGINRGSALGSQSGATARSGNAARSTRGGKTARARKSGDIECTSYGWCRPTPCPAGKKADGTCW
jgi:hypothetical protein